MILLYAVIVTDFLMRAKKEEKKILKLLGIGNERELLFRHIASGGSSSVCVCVEDISRVLFLFLLPTLNMVQESSSGHSAISRVLAQGCVCVCEGENEQLLKKYPKRAYLHHCARTITEKSSATFFFFGEELSHLSERERERCDM